MTEIFSYSTLTVVIMGRCPTKFMLLQSKEKHIN